MMRALFVVLIILLSGQIFGGLSAAAPTQEQEPPQQEAVEEGEAAEEGEPSEEGEPVEEGELEEGESAQQESLSEEEEVAEQVETPPVQPAPPQPPAPSNGLVFRFNNVPITTLIDTVMQELGYSYIIDPRVQGTASIHTMGEIPRESVFEILEQLLQMNGQGIVRQDGMYVFVPLGETTKIPHSLIINPEASQVQEGPAQPGAAQLQPAPQAPAAPEPVV